MTRKQIRETQLTFLPNLHKYFREVRTRAGTVSHQSQLLVNCGRTAVLCFSRSRAQDGLQVWLQSGDVRLWKRNHRYKVAPHGWDIATIDWRLRCRALEPALRHGKEMHCKCPKHHLLLSEVSCVLLDEFIRQTITKWQKQKQWILQMEHMNKCLPCVSVVGALGYTAATWRLAMWTGAAWHMAVTRRRSGSSSPVIQVSDSITNFSRLCVSVFISCFLCRCLLFLSVSFALLCSPSPFNCYAVSVSLSSVYFCLSLSLSLFSVSVCLCVSFSPTYKCTLTHTQSIWPPVTLAKLEFHKNTLELSWQGRFSSTVSGVHFPVHTHSTLFLHQSPAEIRAPKVDVFHPYYPCELQSDDYIYCTFSPKRYTDEPLK